MNVAHIFEENVSKYGERLQVIYEGKEITNVEAVANAHRIGQGLKSLGIGPGDVVAVMMPNCPEVIHAYHAILGIGAAALPIVFLLQPEEVAYILSNSGAKAILTSSLFLDKVREARAAAPELKHVIVLEGEEERDIIPYDALVSEQEAELTLYDANPDETCLLIYTSGTTGRPKGVMITHRNLLAHTEQVLKSREFLPDERGLLVLPLSHVFGIISTLGAAKLGLSGVIMSWFDAGGVLELIDKYKLNVTAMVPTMLIGLLDYPQTKDFDVSSMHYWISSGAALPIETKRAMEARFPGKVIEGYGCSEATGAIALERGNEPRKPGSVGRAIHGGSLRIVDAGDRELPPNTTGEICYRGPNVMKGYWQRPAETAQTLKGGWLHTGDVGHLDGEGYLFITDRLKDLIIRGGENIYPREIEEVLYRHPEVQAAAVIGIPHAHYGEEVHAVVVRRPQSELDEEALLAFCREHIAKFKCPKSIEFRAFLPQNMIGKILKKELRAESS